MQYIRAIIYIQLLTLYYHAYMQVKLGTCCLQPANFFLHIFRNLSDEISPLILAQIIDLTFLQKSLSLPASSLIAEEDLLSKG